MPCAEQQRAWVARVLELYRTNRWLWVTQGIVGGVIAMILLWVHLALGIMYVHADALVYVPSPRNVLPVAFFAVAAMLLFLLVYLDGAMVSIALRQIHGEPVTFRAGLLNAPVAFRLVWVNWRPLTAVVGGYAGLVIALIGALLLSHKLGDAAQFGLLLPYLLLAPYVIAVLRALRGSLLGTPVLLQERCGARVALSRSRRLADDHGMTLGRYFGLILAHILHPGWILLVVGITAVGSYVLFTRGLTSDGDWHAPFLAYWAFMFMPPPLPSLSYVVASSVAIAAVFRIPILALAKAVAYADLAARSGEGHTAPGV